MSALEILLIAVGVVVVAVIAFCSWVRSSAWHQASDTAREIFPVWAAQGPFGNGTQSAIAMRYAWLAVSGDREKVDGMTEQFSQHADSFDADPGKWEETRRTALQSADPTVSQYVAEANRLCAAEDWTRESLDFENFEAMGALDLEIPFTVADVERAHEAKSSQVSPDSEEARRLGDAYRRAHRLAQLSEKAGLHQLNQSEKGAV